MARRRIPFSLFREHGANLVRVRLWNDARWTRYSDLADVKKTIRRARAQGMQVLLDFHYSDDWADGDKQIVPKGWADIDDTDDLARTLYNYTYDTLSALDRAGLMPELVQVGNETNPDFMGSKAWDAERLGSRKWVGARPDRLEAQRDAVQRRHPRGARRGCACHDQAEGDVAHRAA